MKKLAIILIGLFVILNIGFGSIVGLNINANIDINIDPTIDTDTQLVGPSKSPEGFAENNVYYLQLPGLLCGVPKPSDGANPNINQIDIENGRPEFFTYPGSNLPNTVLEYNQSFVGNPYICLVLNSYDHADKVVNVEIGLDKENDDDLEVVCTFPSYHTVGEINPEQGDITMEEEYFEAYGEWQGGAPPAIYIGWLKLKVTMTSPNGDPCKLYCGFDYKLSWCAIPYKHTDLEPRAKIAESSCRQGFMEEGKMKVTVGDRGWFDGRDSYDTNDDLNGNDKIDNYETDHLKYRWSFGNGDKSDWSYKNRNISYVYTSDSIPKGKLFQVFEVNLTVMNEKTYTAWNRTNIKVHRGNHSPEILSLKINNIEQIGDPKTVKSPVDQSVQVHFSAFAIDSDGDELSYYWDFDGDESEYEFIDPDTPTSSTTFSFSEDYFNTGLHKITLMVSDGTPVENTTAHSYIKLVQNKMPVPKIRAWRKGLDSLDTKFYDEITILAGQTIVFDASDSYDPDNLPGFDIDNDHLPDYPLKYRWHFDVDDTHDTSDWIIDTEVEYEYISTGTEYKYIVRLDVDDGISIVYSENFTVFVNVRPVAKIAIEPESYDKHGNFNKNKPIYFNGLESYDPNGDKIKSFYWDLGDGNKSHEENPVHTFSTPSKYTVSLIVIEDTDFLLESEFDQFIVNIPYPPEAPIPRYKVYPLQVYTHNQVYFDAMATIDPDSDYESLRFKWDFGDNTTSSEDYTIHRYLKQGEYLITLQVTDDTGVNVVKSEMIVHVLNRKPVAKIRQLKNIYFDEMVRLSGIDSRDDDGYITRYLWDFGDGVESKWKNESTIEHKWKHAGKYTITLTIMDDQGSTNETQMQFRVKEVDPGSASFFGDGVNSIIAGTIITVIIAMVIIIVMIVIRRTQESI